MNEIKFSYHAGGDEIWNNGHTVQVKYSPGSSISVDGIQFELTQFHFHAPSENQNNGKSYAMEAHLVHADKVGMMFLTLGRSATVLVSSYMIRIQTMWRQAPIAAALVIASGLTQHSKLSGMELGLRKVAEVLFGCVVGLPVSWLTARVWPLAKPAQADAEYPRVPPRANRLFHWGDKIDHG